MTPPSSESRAAPADAARPADADRAAWLAAYDDALATGAGDAPPTLPAADTLPDDRAFLQLLARLRPGAPPDAGAGLVGLCRSALTAATDGRYELRGLHAAGGIGEVWLARDTELGRDVALKVLRPERSDDPALAARFVREARITGRLQHPGIVPVYELAPDGPDDQPPFYTMRLVQGRTFTEAVADYHARRAAGTAGPLELPTLLNAFVAVCQTVAYAHAEGVIHRDLKPANVALGDFGEVVVLDWGFAKELAAPVGWVERSEAHQQGATAPVGLAALDPPYEEKGHAAPSVAGQILGTPAYMAPEQAAGDVEHIDERTDVYGLGAILYEVLTGRPPFPGDDAAATLAAVRAGPPPRPAAARGVHPALEAVCLKAMARDPADRYPSAAEVAREVQHWLADEPVAAHPEPVGARLRRWARRHRPLVAGTTALCLTGLLAAGVIQAVVRQEQARMAQAQAQAAADRAEASAQSERRMQRQLYLNRIALAERTLAAQNPSRAAVLLAECPAHLRGWEWDCLARQCRADVVTLRGPNGHAGTVQAVAFTPDGTALVSAGFDGVAKVWDVATGRLRYQYPGHSKVVYDVAVSPDGGRVATASWDGTVQVWDAATGVRAFTLPGHDTQADRVLFSPDGRRLYTLDLARTLRMWDAATGAPLGQIPLDRQATAALAVSPDGRTLVVGGWDGAVLLFDAATGAPAGSLAGHRRYIRAAAFSRDGRYLATGDGDIGRGDPGEIRVWTWDGADSQERYTFRGHTEPIFCLAFTPDGSRLASASQDHTVKLWNLAIGQEALTLHAHADAVRAAAFSPDGRYLATAGADRGIRLWDAGPWDDAAAGRGPTVHTHAGRALGVAFRPDGRAVTSIGDDRALLTSDPGRPDAGPRRFALNSLAVEGADWDYFAVAYSPDGARLATANSAGTVLVLDAGDPPTLTHTFHGHSAGSIKGVAFRPDGAELATAGWDRTVRVWDLAAGRERLVLRDHTEPVLAVAYSPDGRWLASAGNDRTVRLWATATWQDRPPLQGHTAGVRAVAFSPDGQWLASAGDDWTVRVWQVATGEEVLTLRGHADRVHGVAFAPDGRTLATAGYDGAVKLWDVADLAD